MGEEALNTDEFVKWRDADHLIDKFHTYNRLCRMTEEDRPKLMLELNKFSLNFGPVPLHPMPPQNYRETWLIDRLLAASSWHQEAVDGLEKALEACAESLALLREQCGMTGEGDGKDRKADGFDMSCSLDALEEARTALKRSRCHNLVPMRREPLPEEDSE